MAELRSVGGPAPLDLKETLERGRWQEALFLTYSFDLPFFESYLLPILVRNGCRSVAVAACARWLPERIQHWSEAHEIREAGGSYTLSQVSVPGVFHPKLLLAVGEDRGAVLVGSGNVSEYGMSTGGELFTLVEWLENDVPSLAREAWQLCREITRRLPVDRAFRERVEAMGRLVPSLNEAVQERMLIHNLDRPILDQFVEIIPEEDVREILTWSPFTDRRLGALEALVDRLHPEHVVIGVQPELTKLDGSRLTELRDRFDQTSWKVREIVRAADGARPSMIHAKGIIVTLGSGDQVALTGSPNLSTPALARTATQANLEVAVLHRAPDLRGMLFGEDSTIGLGEEVDLGRLTWDEDPTTSEQNEAHQSLQLLGARNDGKVLRLDIGGEPTPETELILDGMHPLTMRRVDEGWIAPLADGHPPRTAALAWDGGRSGPVIISDLPRLAAMRRGPETRPPATLSALDYGADSDILWLLEELAKVAIVSVHDLERLLGGRGGPTPAEEAAEAAGTAPVIRLEDLDFESIRQHPRAYGYGTGRQGDLDMPRIVLWLDEVVGQFDALQEAHLRLVAQPIPTDEDEVETEETPDDESTERRHWPVSKRVAVLVRNRLRRGIDGMADPRFRSVIDAEWMAMNHALWLAVLHRIWVRESSPEPILQEKDLGPLTSDLLAGYWGDDRGGGYVAQLDDEARAASATVLRGRHGDALLAATSIRLLETRGEVAARAPYAVAAYVQVAQPLGLLSEEVVERALVFLDRVDEAAGPYHEQLLKTVDRFSWERFADNLAWKYGLSSAAVLGEAPGIGAFASGDILVVARTGSLPVGPTTMPVFAEWVQEVRARSPDRDVIQMAWGRNLIVIYDAKGEEVFARRVIDDKLGNAVSIASDVTPDAIASLSLGEESSRATA